VLGISSSARESIVAAVERMFDKLAYAFLGDIPRLRDRKILTFSANPSNTSTLAHIFLECLNGQIPNHIERDVLKSILNNAHGYVESLKNKTASNVAEGIDALVKEAKANGSQVDRDEIHSIFSAEMDKARKHMKTITEAETTKTRNVAFTTDISKVASSIDDNDPTVFFVVVRDGETCEECMKLHMMPDKVTPRLWKLRDVAAGYHKRGEDRPSMCGEHPHCRCSITYLPKSFGFNSSGHITYIKPDFDAYEEQKAS
jgi:hypothetical protein